MTTKRRRRPRPDLSGDLHLGRTTIPRARLLAAYDQIDQIPPGTDDDVAADVMFQIVQDVIRPPKR